MKLTPDMQMKSCQASELMNTDIMSKEACCKEGLKMLSVHQRDYRWVASMNYSAKANKSTLMTITNDTPLVIVGTTPLCCRNIWGLVIQFSAVLVLSSACLFI